jgi:phosphoserine aminotransferase
MNVIWQIPDKMKETDFFKQSKEAGMVQLKGHRLVGGVRASLYNAITLEETERLVILLKSMISRP